MNWLTFRLKLLKVNMINSWRSETAYYGDTWSNLLSTISFSIAYILFVEVIFANISSLAGYSRNEILLLLVINQISFYSLYVWSFNNVQALIESVNQGSFDMVLVKPVPALYYSTIRNISLLTVLRDGIPATAVIAMLVDWSQLSITPVSLLLSLVAFVAGQLAINGFFFLLAMPAFKLGQSSAILSLAYPVMSVRIPAEGLDKSLRSALSLIIPMLVPAALVTSVLLNKSDMWFNFLLAIGSGILFTILKILAWKWALHNYTSASS